MTEFFAPYSLAAVALMGINDHVLKARFHNALTGKLSDIAGCFFLPLFVSALLGMLMPGRVRARIIVGGLAAALVFTVLELSDRADAMFARAVLIVGAPIGIHRVAMTRDLTDLLALMVVPLGCWYGLQHARSSSLQIARAQEPRRVHEGRGTR